MSVVVVAGGRGSPGVTTFTTALAAGWAPGHPVRVIEVDPDGAVLAARCNIAHRPGFADVVPALRRNETPDWQAASTPAVMGVPTVLGPPSGDEAGALLSAVSATLIAALSTETGVDTIIDAGRLSPTHPLNATFRHADHVVVLYHPTTESLMSLQPRLAGLQTPVFAVSVGTGVFDQTETNTFLGSGRHDVVPWNRRGVTMLNSGSRLFFRNPYGQAVLRIAATLAGDPKDRIATVDTTGAAT